MEKGTVEPDRSHEIEVFLKTAEIDLRTTPGARTISHKEGNNLITTIDVKFPGSYDETPGRYKLVITKPRRASGPVKTELIHTRRELNPGVDVENKTQTVVFETRYQTFGGKTSVRAVEGRDDLVGTRTFYVDSDTPHFRYEDVGDPFAFAQKNYGPV